MVFAVIQTEQQLKVYRQTGTNTSSIQQLKESAALTESLHASEKNEWRRETDKSRDRKEKEKEMEVEREMEKVVEKLKVEEMMSGMERKKHEGEVRNIDTCILIK